MSQQTLHKSLGPILLSALSFFLSFLCIQPLARFLDPSFSLLKTRGIGKIALMLLALYHVILFLSTQSKTFFSQIISDSSTWITEKKSRLLFTKFFLGFALLHLGFITLTYFFHPGSYTQVSHLPRLLFRRIPVLLLGLIGSLGVALSEELLFRSFLYNYFRKFYAEITSVITSSFIFMILHNLTNPFALLTTDYRLGIGLFLLGVLLNYIYINQNSLAASIGAHAGLVYIKVFFRKIPLITIPETRWFHPDLRQAILVHILFICAILFFSSRALRQK